MNLKKCSKCGQEKSTECFYKEKQCKGGLRPDCKDCFSSRSKEKYDTDPIHRKKKLARNMENTIRTRHEYQVRILKILKETGCKDCGETDFMVLEFDHISDKFKSISKMVAASTAWNKIEAEMNKCEVRCCNCHRRKTAKQLNYYKDIDLSDI